MSYWEERIQKQQEVMYDRGIEAMEEKLKKSYIRTMNSIMREIKDLYDDILEDGEPSKTELYRYNRLYKLMKSVNEKLMKLGADEVKIDHQGMTELFLDTVELVGGKNDKFSFVNDLAMRQATEQPWCEDGKLWSDRIWGHKAELAQSIQTGIEECVGKGLAKDKVVKDIQTRFGVSYNQADRIVRTELSAVQNQAAKQGYKNAGFTHYRILAAIDERTSEICQEMDGEVFSFDDAKIGVNMPPLHPNCRSTIIAVKE